MINKIDKNTKIRFIKLGHGGLWEKDCIEKDHCIRLGYAIDMHQNCIDGNWDKVQKYYLNKPTDKGSATRHTNQIRQFYEAKENDIWITFYQRKLYWCQAEKEITELKKDKSRIRKVANNGEWSCYDVKGQKKLNIDNLDGRVTKVQGFRGTICGVDLSKYLIKKINGETVSIVEKTDENIKELRLNIKELIKGLHYNDFELLMDLIFTNLGLKRMSVLGKTEKDIDIDLLNPINQNRIFVQIKSRSNKEQFQEYINTFNEYDQYQEMYFIVHTSNPDLQSLESENENVNLIDMDKLPDLVINSGLISWLKEKRS